MFTPSVTESTKMTDVIFIAGVSYDNIKNFMSDSNGVSKSVYLQPEILISFPDNKDLITLSILDFVFPDGIEISYMEKEAKFYPIVLTNEFGVRSYIYIMKLYEKISYGEIFPQTQVKKYSESYSPRSKPITDATNRKKTFQFNEKLNQGDEYNSEKCIYLPYAICLWSNLSNIETFKKIMTEIHNTINYKNYNIAEDKLRNFRNIELINLIIFTTNILIPPSFSEMIINFHFKSVKLYNTSVLEIPCSDYCIKVLFDCLEISVILKLWSSILTEKHIILIANQNSLLFTVCEGLLSLIFPFKWLHTYIPILPNEQLDYLESPTPYIMGVLSTMVDYQYLKEKFSNHIICDVNTSLIYGHCFTPLPFNEEVKLRKKLQFIKNPETYDIESLQSKFTSEDKNKLNFSLYCANVEDVCSKRSFSQNVQHIFLRIFKSTLEDIDKLYIKDGVFHSQKFLEDFHIEDYKEFWEKIINTVAFEFFILNFQYLDHSFSRIFKNICRCELKKNEDDDEIRLNKDKDNLFSFKINMPQSMNYLFHKLETQAMTIIEESNSMGSAEIPKYLERCKKLNSDYEGVISCINSEKLKQSSLTSNIPCSNINYNNNFFNYNFYQSFSFQKRPSKISNNQYNGANNKKKRNNLSCDLAKNSKDYLDLNVLQNDVAVNTDYMRESLDQNKIEMNKSKFKGGSNFNYSIVESPVVIINKKNSNDCFRIYGKNGFIKFINDLFGVLNMKDISQLGHLLGISDEIKSHLKEKANKKTSYGKETISKILELENENDLESSFMDSSIRLSFGREKRSSPILEFSHKVDSFQYYILMAFYLEEYSESKELIFDMYRKAYEKDRKSFPRKRFFEFLKSIDTTYLKIIHKDILACHKSINNMFVKYKMLLKIINIKLDKRISTDIKTNARSEKADEKIESQIFSFELNNSFQDRIDLMRSTDSPRTIKKQISKSDKIKKTEKKYSTFVEKLMIEKLHRGKSKSITCKNLLELDMKRKTSHLGEINGEKIMENYKSNDLGKDTYIKKYLVNTFTQINKADKDPISLAEDISVRLFSLLMKNSVYKYKPEMISNILLTDLSQSSEFQEIKNLVAQLQIINLKLLKEDRMKTCFWLNIYNFLVIFKIIFKKEVPSNYYEWYRFLKNSYFVIGGYEISLYEIENCILTNSIISYNKYGEYSQFKKDDCRNILLIENIPLYTIYGIYISTKSSPPLRIYFPNNLNQLLELNAIDFLSRNINFDIDSNILSVPELIIWVDPEFLKNIRNYAKLISEEFVNFLVSIEEDLDLRVAKYFWMLNFVHVCSQ